MSLLNWKKKIDWALLERRALKKMVAEEQTKLEEVGVKLSNVVKAQEILQLVAETVQTKVHGQIAGVVSRCLTTIFDEPYQFEIRFEKKRGKTEAKMVFIRGGLEIEKPTKEIGGGVIDVAAFALRLAALLLSRPRKRKVLILDEPFRFLHSPIYLERLVALLESLSAEFEVQFIIVTTIEELQIGKVIHL